MKIVLTPEIEAWLNTCRDNILYDEKAEFLGAKVTKAGEKKLQRAMSEAGFAEFQGPESEWPSLFLSADEWESSPYHSTVRLDWIKDSSFYYETRKIAGRELFNSDCIQKDPERSLNDWMKLRAMDRNFESIYLYQTSKEEDTDDTDWMMDAPSEAVTNNRPAEKAHGNVLTFGLGIGYFVFMAMRNPAVKSITVVENSPEVIAMFRRFLEPQFPQDVPLYINEADAYEMFTEEFLSDFDYIYTDIWLSSEDGLASIDRLLSQYNPPFEKADFWIEDSCFEVMWTLSVLYFESLVYGEAADVSETAQYYMDKIRRYYENIDETVDDVERLKFLAYDTKTIRSILAGK